jgi:hypothetical protein
MQGSEVSLERLDLALQATMLISSMLKRSLRPCRSDHTPNWSRTHFLRRNPCGSAMHGEQRCPRGACQGRTAGGLLALVELLRQVQLVTHFRDLVLLCFEPVDVMFFVFQHVLKQLACGMVPGLKT